MILITGAAGKTGQAVIRALAAKQQAVRALVHRSEQVQMVKDLGAREALVGDMRQRATLDQALLGVRAVYHICPNVSSDEVTIGQIAITAAQTAGVEHFVYHSVLHPQTEAMPHHWLKLRVEEQLFESGLAYTILQPAAYMQNVLAHWDQIIEQGTYPVPYAAETRLGMVDLLDVAAAAATVLTGPGHQGATYELAGPDVLTQNETAAILSEQLGWPVRVQVVFLDAWERVARASGLGDYQVETLVAMFRYYEHYGFWGNAQVLGWLLGRPPASFADFVQRAARERLAEPNIS
jgi:uncharacterized protein YbjT (DUF2867 family)